MQATRNQLDVVTNDVARREVATNIYSDCPKSPAARGNQSNIRTGAPALVATLLLLVRSGPGFLHIQPLLAKFGGLRRICSRRQIAFFDEKAPTGTTILRALTPLKFVENFLRVFGSFNHRDYSTRPVGFLVEQNDRE